ncbi:MAG: hypothetical protein ABI584_12985 [Acidobacteriota bacterium]
MKRAARAFLALSLVPASSLSSPPAGLPADAPPDWTAPPYWTRPAASPREEIDRHALAAGRQALVTGPVALPFFALPPCRQYDSRSASPLLQAVPRNVAMTGAPCGIPVGAAAVSLNVAVFNIVGASSNAVFKLGIPGGTSQAWLNFPPTQGQIDNAGVAPVDGSGNVEVSVFQGGGSVDFVVDVNGYYAPGANLIFTGTVLVNVTAAGVVNVSPAGLGLPADTLTRNPVALRASAWTGTTTSMTMALVASLGLFNGTTWPVRVYDPTGAFTTGSAIVQLVVMLDPP